ARSSGALSIWSNALTSPPQVSAQTRVSAAVSVVLPWSTWPIVPTFTCNLLRSNFSFDTVSTSQKINALLAFVDNGLGDVIGRFRILHELHGERSTALGHGTQLRGISKHFRQGNFGSYLFRTTVHVVHTLQHTTATVKVAHDVAHVIFRSLDF